MNVELWIIGFCLLMSVLLLINYIDFLPKKNQYRQKQSKNILRDNLLKTKLEQYSKEKVRHSTRTKTELFIKQAGFQLTYAEYLFIKVMSSVVVAIGTFVILGNPYVFIIFLGLGYVLPNEIVKFIRIRRIETLEKQIGPFMYMLNKRYAMNKDFTEALRLTKDELKGMEPLYTELTATYIEIKEMGATTEEAMDNLAERSTNRFLKRYADYYRMVAGNGTDEMRKVQLNEAYLQYEEDRELKILANRELAGPKNNAYISLGMVPALALYQANVSDDFVDFMLHTFIGQVGTAFVVTVMVACLWFINSKINAPLD